MVVVVVVDDDDDDEDEWGLFLRICCVRLCGLIGGGGVVHYTR